MAASDNRRRFLAEMENVLHHASAADILSGGGEQILWDALGVVGATPHPAAAGPTEVVSDDGADALAGDGARRLRIRGVTDTYAAFDEIVELDGLTPAPMQAEPFRVNRAEVIDAGDDEWNVGTLQIRQVAGAVVIGQVAPTYSRTLTSTYSVALGTRLLIDFVTISGDPQGSETAFFRVRLGGVKQILGEFNGRGGEPGGLEGVGGAEKPVTIPEGSDVWVAASAPQNSRLSSFMLAEIAPKVETS